MKNGYLLIDKPVGWSSFDCVSVIRKKYKLKKAGHAGTLDPMASGLLIILINKACSWFDKFQQHEKAYETELLLGINTDSLDLTGNITEVNPLTQAIDKDNIISVLNSFKGEISQLPPKYSALKINGKPAYAYARQGHDIEMKPRQTFVKEIKFQEFKNNILKFNLKSSKGFYVRSLCADIGYKLGSCAVMTALKRTEHSGFDLSQAISMKTLPEDIYEHIITEEPL